MKENSGQDRKQKIRDKYKGTDASEIEIIPAKPTADFMESGGIRRVAAYVRVSTDNANRHLLMNFKRIIILSTLQDILDGNLLESMQMKV